MKTAAPTVPIAKELIQLDNWHFGIRWSDGTVTRHHLADLQSHCPCAACENKSKIPQAEVSATRIRSIGRYGIHVNFTCGCRYGIYSYELLWKLGQREGSSHGG